MKKMDGYPDETICLPFRRLYSSNPGMLIKAGRILIPLPPIG